MTVAHDASSVMFASATSPMSTTLTPVGTLKSVLMFVVTPLAATVSVTYGGVALSAVADAHDTAGEPTHCYGFHLGAGIPTGAQTVEVTFTGAAARCLGAGQTAAADTQVGASGIVQGDTANPQVALDTTTNESLRYVGISSGHDNVASVAPLAAMTAVQSIDVGSEVRRLDRQTTASTGSFTIGYTATSEDCALVAIAVEEVASTANPYPYIGGGYYPVEG